MLKKIFKVKEMVWEDAGQGKRWPMIKAPLFRLFSFYQTDCMVGLVWFLLIHLQPPGHLSIIPEGEENGCQNCLDFILTNHLSKDDFLLPPFLIIQPSPLQQLSGNEDWCGCGKEVQLALWAKTNLYLFSVSLGWLTCPLPYCADRTQRSGAPCEMKFKLSFQNTNTMLYIVWKNQEIKGS